MRIRRKVAQCESRLVLDANPCPVAITPRLGSMKLNFCLQFQFRGSAQRLAQDIRLEPRLSSVVDMLVLASSASPEVRTLRRNPRRRRRQDLIEPGPRKPRPGLDDRRIDLLFGNDIRQKDRLAAPLVVGGQPRQSIAPVDQLFDS